MLLIRMTNNLQILMQHFHIDSHNRVITEMKQNEKPAKHFIKINKTLLCNQTAMVNAFFAIYQFVVVAVAVVVIFFFLGCFIGC